MNNISKRVALVLIVIVGLAFLIYAAYAPNVSEETIRIGAILPLTGAAADHGENQKAGIDLAVTEINDTGGINGKKLKVIYEDDHTEAKDSATAAHKLINVDDVPAIIGGTWSPLADAIIPIIDESKTVLVSPSALKDTLGYSSEYVFLTYPPVRNFEFAFHEYLVKHGKVRIVAVTDNAPWGLSHIETLKKAIVGTESVIVKEILFQGFDNNDIPQVINQIRLLKPDIIFAPFGVADAEMLVRRREELNLKTEILGSLQFTENYESGLLPASMMHGITTFTGTAPSAEFAEKFRAEYGKPPGIYADTAYDAVYVLKYAFEKATADARGEELRSVVKQIPPFSGASGVIDFSKANYSSSKETALYQVVDGRVTAIDW